MTQNSILITGCSSGIGYDAAKTLHQMGWRVFATCRNEVDCARLREEGLESFPLDYEDETSIKAAVTDVLERTGGTIDALFNNGAYAVPGLMQDMPRDALRANFEANVFGYFDLANQLIPAMAAQGHGRIVNCSSVLGLVAGKARGAYVGSKFALEGMTDAMRLELKDQNIDVILIEPGPIATDIRVKSQAQFEKWIDWENSLSTAFYKNRLLPRLYAPKDDANKKQNPPSLVTKRLIHALTARQPKPRYYVTIPTHLSAVLKRIMTTRGLDRIVSRF